MNLKNSSSPPRRKKGLTIGLITATLFAIGITYFYSCEDQLDRLNNKPFIKPPLNLELSENFGDQFFGKATINPNEISEFSRILAEYIFKVDIKDSSIKDVFF